MADAVRMSHDRDVRIVHYITDEAVRSARDDQVHILVALQQFIDPCPVFDQLGEAFRQPCPYRSLIDGVKQDPVGRSGLAASFQDDAVAALDAKAGDLHERIRSGFEDDTDDSDRTRLLRQDQPGVEFPLKKYSEQRVVHIDQIIDPVDTAADLLAVEPEPAAQRPGKLHRFRPFKIHFVRLQDLFLSGDQCFIYRFQRLVPDLLRQSRQDITACLYLFDILL